MKFMRIVGFCLMLLSMLLGTLVDTNQIDIDIQSGVFTSFILFLLGIFILCISKDK